MIHRGFFREEILCAVRPGALRDFGAIQFSFPGVRQSAIHVAGNRYGVGRLPGTGFVAEKREFKRKGFLVLLDKVIHAAGVCFHDLARFGIKERGVALGGASKSVGSKLFVDDKRLGAQNFGKLAAGDAAEQVHLPETVLRHYVALRFCEVFH